MSKFLQNREFDSIVKLITQAQNRAYLAVNTELVSLYWQVGKHISDKVKQGEWGEGIVKQLAEHIHNTFPQMKGFTKRGLYRMKQFYETYHKIEKVSALLTQLNWTNHLNILSKCKSIEEKQYYVLTAIKDKWSTRELIRQIDSGIFERTMLTNTKVSAPLTQIHDKVKHVFKDTYVFEFLDLPSNYNEKDLQQAIINNLKKFLLELGSGFSFIGQEYRLQVGLHDYYIDLLFFHRELQCLVAVELKTTDFKPEHLGQLNFYLEALDTDVKLANENPSIGILMCKGKDTEVVEFALRRNLSPAMIADYETKLIDKKLLQQKIHELYQIFDEQQDKSKT